MSAQNLPIGTFLGPYRVLALLGKGGMGEVYRAYDPKLGREVAIKVLPATFAENAERLRRFEREARAASALNHPNILTIYELGTHEGSPFLVMELLQGSTLRELMDQGPLTVARIAELGRQTAAGLAAAHERGIIHRDLKPENLFLTRHGVVKILDFGLAKRSDMGEEPTAAMTLETGTGMVVGTVFYMSPEQATGKPVGFASDQFSLGVVLYEMLAGRRPFSGDSVAETLAAIVRDEPVPLESLATGIPAGLTAIVHRCLAKDPAKRYRSDGELEAALAAMTTEEGTPVLRSPSGLRARLRLPRRGRLPAAAVALTAVLGLLLWWRPWVPAAPRWDDHLALVLPLENRTGDPSLDDLGQQAADLVRQDLEKVQSLKLAVTPGGRDTHRLAEAAHARLVATGSYARRGRDLVFQARLEDPWTGTTIYSLGPWQAPAEDPTVAMKELRQYLAGALAVSLCDNSGARFGTWRAPRLDTWLQSKKYYEQFNADPEGTIAALRKLLESDPDGFDAIQVLLAYIATPKRAEEARALLDEIEPRSSGYTFAERGYLRYFRARAENRPAEGVKALLDVRAACGDFDSLHYDLGNLYLNLHHDGSALREFRPIMDSSMVWEGWFAGWIALPMGRILHQRGEYEEELRLARKGMTVVLDNTFFRIREIGALAAMGRVAEVEQAVQAGSLVKPSRGLAGPPRALEAVAASEFHAHGREEEGRRWAARFLDRHPPSADPRLWGDTIHMLRILGRQKEALALVDARLAKDPGNPDPLSDRGMLLAELGAVAEARAVDAQLAALPPRPGAMPGHPFERACVLAALGQKEQMVELLRQAVMGGSNLAIVLTHDEDFRKFRGYPPFEDLIKPVD
ncbi:serine/threonine-protein kinase [Geothrix oryzisoli]|uniref:serine/threonine-protein kinase n=1 Tax=Geothrix oryzisoli TaxID=2922721 RepID=UPI001FAC7F95|nr:serine/threonine-protein kinase [Geothrix oryzisoli]